MKTDKQQNISKSTVIFRTALILGTFACTSALAAPAPPDSGSILQDTQKPQLQRQKPVPPALGVEEPKPDATLDDVQPIMVKSFRFKGQLPVAEEQLQAVLASEIGKSHTLKGLNELAHRLTIYMRQQGYMLAFAYIPAQQIRDGVVDIAVVPGKYGKVNINNKAWLRGFMLSGLFSEAKPGGVIKTAVLERALLNADDLPGSQVRSTLGPGSTPGTADLTVEAENQDRINATLYVDNWGSRYTGRVRTGMQLSLNSVIGIGDSLTLGGLTTFDGLDNYDFGYSAYAGTSGLKLAVRHSRTNYSLGDLFANMRANGTANITTVEALYPFLRSRKLNLTGSAGYDYKDLTDNVDSVGSSVGKTDHIWRVGLSGSLNDELLGGGASSMSMTYSRGELSINDDTARSNDTTTAQTAGSFGKFNLNLRRQQQLIQDLQLHLSFAGQMADKNLDSSEKFYLGGPSGVRAYPQSEAPGDMGYRISAELRYRVAPLSTSKTGLYTNGFFDCGGVRTNKHVWSGYTGKNDRHLSGAGIGLMWVLDKYAVVRMDYAWKTTNDAATSDRDKSGQLWLQGVLYY